MLWDIEAHCSRARSFGVARDSTRMIRPYDRTSINVAIILFGAGIVGSMIGIGWYRTASPSKLDRDTVLFIVKMFAGITFGLLILMLLLRYA